METPLCFIFNKHVKTSIDIEPTTAITIGAIIECINHQKLPNENKSTQIQRIIYPILLKLINFIKP